MSLDALPLQIHVLGTGDSMGVPRVYCSCVVCNEARSTGVNRRYRSSILLKSDKEELLVDCGPDWRTQMELINKRTSVDVLITHAHYDHIGGLPELADLCRWTGNVARLYAPAEVLGIINRQFPWVGNHLEMNQTDKETVLLGWKVTPFRVNHGWNGYAYAYRFERGDTAWVYCPDSIGLQQAEKNRMQGLALLILGTSFYHEPAEFHLRSVYDMVEAEELLKELRPGTVWFTHMSHDIDFNNPPPIDDSISLARAGTVITI